VKEWRLATDPGKEEASLNLFKVGNAKNRQAREQLASLDSVS